MRFLSYSKIGFVTLALFILLLPVSLSIRYMQNDDWNRYVSVARFLTGNFELLSVTATTFYTQGILGMIFASVFPLNSLPVMTSFVAVLCFYVTAIISFKFLKQNKINSVLIGLLIFLNPIFIYSVWGFMTEIYLLLFILISIYFANKSSNLKLNIFWILGFFAKQSAIVIPFGVVVAHIISRKYKLAMINLLILTMVLAFYFFIFPKTSEMTGQKSIKLENLSSIKHVYSNIFASLIYISIFLLPITLSATLNRLKNLKALHSVLVLITSLLISCALYLMFINTNFPWKIFPYYPNVFTSMGFFYQGISGAPTGYNYSLFFNLLSSFSLFIMVLFAFFIMNSKAIKKLTLSFEFYSLLFGIFLIIVNPFVFDRYILILLPIAMFLLLKLSDYKINPKILIIFIVLEAFISLDFSSEFIMRQNKIWEIGNMVNKEFNIEKKFIRADHAWNSLYNVSLNNYEYEIRFDDNKSMEAFESGKFFIKSKIILIKNEKL